MRRRSLIVVLAVVLTVFALPPGLPSALAAPAAPGCEFVLGFKALADQIPDIVGDCVTNATPQPNGDVQQQTANGLLAWRKIDNWTAFTNGSRTWINGPCGLQDRANDDLFPWEQGGDCDAAPTVDTPPPPPATPAPTVQPAGFNPHDYLGQGDAYNCDDFTNDEAEAVLDADPSDPNRLDANHDGDACEAD